MGDSRRRWIGAMAALMMLAGCGEATVTNDGGGGGGGGAGMDMTAGWKEVPKKATFDQLRVDMPLEEVQKTLGSGARKVSWKEAYGLLAGVEGDVKDLMAKLDWYQHGPGEFNHLLYGVTAEPPHLLKHASFKLNAPTERAQTTLTCPVNVVQDLNTGAKTAQWAGAPGGG